MASSAWCIIARQLKKTQGWKCNLIPRLSPSRAYIDLTFAPGENKRGRAWSVKLRDSTKTEWCACTMSGVAQLHHHVCMCKPYSCLQSCCRLDRPITTLLINYCLLTLHYLKVVHVISLPPLNFPASILFVLCICSTNDLLRCIEPHSNEPIHHCLFRWSIVATSTQSTCVYVVYMHI